MARISLLFSLAIALVLGSSFLSVNGHVPPVPLSSRISFPKTVSELQTLPFNDITQILNRKEHFAPKTAQFKAMFTLCKGYVAYLESLYKFENPIVDVLGIAKTKYALMAKAILRARNGVIRKVDKKNSKKLRRSSADFAKVFQQIQELIVSISAKHDFKADAKISDQESMKIRDAILFFKYTINNFMDVVYDVEEMKMKKVAHRARKLEESDRGDRIKNRFGSFFRKFSDKFGGYMGGKTHGRELTESEFNANAQAGVHHVQGFEDVMDNFYHFWGGFLGGEIPHGRELTEANVGAQAGVKVNESLLSKFERLYGYLEGGKNSGRKLAETKDGAQLDAAGKMKFAGGDGFRSLNRAHFKHFV